MNEIARTDGGPLTKDQVVAQKRLIQEVMAAVMKDGVHYGVIPGCKQPSLYKAGSEAILSTFRIAVDPSVEDLSTRDCYRYRVTLRGIVPSGEIVGAGVGECSTDEEKYHWRGAVNDKEFDATPEDRRRIKYSKPTSWNQAGEVKQVRTNPADLANTALKMAKKRAQIDLTLTATGASDVFAQDLEDLPDEVREELTREDGGQKSGKPDVKQPQAKQPAHDNGDKATDGQVKILHVKMKQAGVTEAAFKAHYKIEHVGDLPKSAVNDAIKAIGEGKIAEIAKAEEAKADTPELTKCGNCGEYINEDGTGHLDGCDNQVV
jgi:hypothetical protein